jgi:hypothetical protein
MKKSNVLKEKARLLKIVVAQRGLRQGLGSDSRLPRPIFYSLEAVLSGFTLLELARIEKCSATFAVRKQIYVD